MTIREAMAARTWPGLRPFAAPRWLHRVRWFAQDFAVVVAVIGVYFVLRGQAPGRDGFAVALTDHLVVWERWAHVFWEPQIQHWSIRWHAVQEMANFIYAYGHFPVLGAMGAWLWWRERRAFVFVRNVMFVSMAIGLVFYYALPAAPPRLMATHGYDFGFKDTVFGGHTAVSYAQPSLILNEYAAIPSFHFGWIALAAAAVWFNTRSRWLRALAVTLTALMTWAIVASANHLFIDMALGGIVVGLSWVIARRITPGARRAETAEFPSSTHRAA